MNENLRSNFKVGANHLGKAVYANQVFNKGDLLYEFKGPLLQYSEVPKEHSGEEDRFMQIGENLYLGPSGEVDDLFNHSCTPNAGLLITSPEKIFLIAIKDIAKDEEVTWDYSTTILSDSWTMTCDCRSERCRKVIGDFSNLNREIQIEYRELNILPDYILKFMECGPKTSSEK